MAATPDVAHVPLGWHGDPAQVFSELATIGYAGVELQVRNPDHFDPQSVARHAKDAGLTIIGLSTGPVGTEDRLFLTSPDASIRRRATDRVKAILDVAAEYRVHLTIGGIRGFSAWAANPAEGMGWFRDAIHELLPIAEELDVPLVLEPQNRYVTDLLTTVSTVVEFIQSYDSRWLAMEVDTYHMSLEEPSIPAAIVQAYLSGTLVHVQLGDSNRRAPGRGHLNWLDIFETLRSIRYVDWMTVECTQLPDSRATAQQAYAFLNALYPDPAPLTVPLA
jgi:5-keto-L-gluconate epimerase